MHAFLLQLIPALIAKLVLIVCLRLVADGPSMPGMLIGCAFVVLVIGLPGPDLSFYLLQGPLHAGTALWCLLAFGLLRRHRVDFGWCLAVVLLGTGLIGDFQVIALGIGPVFGAGVLACLRARRLRAGLCEVGAAVASLVVALITRSVALALGTFSFGNGRHTVAASQFAQNLDQIGVRGLQLLGARFVPIWAMASQPSYVTIVRDVVLVAAHCRSARHDRPYVLVGCCREERTSRRRRPTGRHARARADRLVRAVH